MRVRNKAAAPMGACTKETEEAAVFVFLDERYCHPDLRSETSGAPENRPSPTRKCIKGGGLIDVHPITRDGPLVADSFEHHQIAPGPEGWFWGEGRRRPSRVCGVSDGRSGSDSPHDGEGDHTWPRQESLPAR